MKRAAMNQCSRSISAGSERREAKFTKIFGEGDFVTPFVTFMRQWITNMGIRQDGGGVRVWGTRRRAWTEHKTG